MNAQEILKRNLQLSEFGHPIWSESSVLSAMEEYAQQSQSNPSKLVEALKNICSLCDSQNQTHEAIWCVANDALVKYNDQQDLESYKDGWVSITTPPEINNNVLFYSPTEYNGEPFKGYRHHRLDRYFTLSGNQVFGITHWQPLPPAPIQNTNIQNK